jgi:hypothetical protein
LLSPFLITLATSWRYSVWNHLWVSGSGFIGGGGYGCEFVVVTKFCTFETLEK